MPAQFHGNSRAGALRTIHFVNEMRHGGGNIFEKKYIVLPKSFDFAIR